MHVFFSIFLLFGLAAVQDTAEHVKDPILVIAELDRLAGMELWPGFDPASYPIALFDGADTWLFRHPSPPEGFRSAPNSQTAWVYEGRHPAMRWNSKAEIGGVTTATILLNIQPDRPAIEEASIIVHETFHIFQDERHPGWTANEAHRFTYPIDDAQNYLLTIIEDHALARALESKSDKEAAAWAARGLVARRERTTVLADEHRAFETGLEMMEGTARYLAQFALGKSESTATLLDILPPDQFRWRPYATGCALAALLDRFDGGWKQRIEDTAELTLERALEDFLRKLGASPADFTADELAGFKLRAEKAIADLLVRRKSLREEFRSREGWRVILKVAPGAELLATERFDPITNALLGGKEMLHGNILILSHERGRVEMRNPRSRRGEFVGLNALTTTEGEHPVFGGIRSAVFSGFTGEPEVETEGGKVKIATDGFSLEFSSAALQRDGRHLIVLLKKTEQ